MNAQGPSRRHRSRPRRSRSWMPSPPYEATRRGSGGRSLRRFRGVGIRIEDYPARVPEVSIRASRRALTHRFPYGVLYPHRRGHPDPPLCYRPGPTRCGCPAGRRIVD